MLEQESCLTPVPSSSLSACKNPYPCPVATETTVNARDEELSSLFSELEIWRQGWQKSSLDVNVRRSGEVSQVG